MPLLWLALIAVIVWAVIGLVRPGDGERGRQGRETPQEILDRRFASDEIDADAYRQARGPPGGAGTGLAMTWLRRRWVALTVLVTATAALVASVIWAGSATWRPTAGTMGPGLRGEGPVRSIADADRAAGRFAERWGLHVGEVMQFDNGFYAELVDPAGNGATEVLIDPQSGAVQIEFGPAMMWNTAYGMHPTRGDRTATVGPDQARRIADQWLRDNRPGEHAD